MQAVNNLSPHKLKKSLEIFVYCAVCVFALVCMCIFDLNWGIGGMFGWFS